MKYQKTKWSCGAAVVRNCLRSFGLRVTEQQIRKLAGTTKELGTDEVGITKALQHFGFDVFEYKGDDLSLASFHLHDRLRKGMPVILCVENWEHWVLAIGSLGTSVAIVDSSNFNVNKNENGVHVWDLDKLHYKWYNTRKGLKDDHRIYALAVGEKGRYCYEDSDNS